MAPEWRTEQHGCKAATGTPVIAEMYRGMHLYIVRSVLRGTDEEKWYHGLRL